MPNQKRYKYTISSNNGILSSEQRDFFEINGYIIIRQLINETLLDRFKQRFIDICEGKVNRGGITVMKDISSVKINREAISKERIVNKIQDIVWDDVFEQYFLHPELLDYVQCFTGNNIMAMHSMLINKPPDTGSMTSRHPMHQDLHYFAFRPADRIVATWTAMQTVTKANGCLFVLPGSHVHPGKLLPHEYPEWKGGVNKGFHGITGYDSHQKKYLDMNPGDTVLFHPLLIHGSGPNTSQETRKAISCHFASCECQYIDVTGTTQQNIAIEVKEIARRRGFNDMDFKDFWKFRSRLVRGLKMHL
ncbi:phytanoyl-CoA dioxygenase, peroxisomal-like [Metopolophium dirhodum]|uniref:phytanoyl-CoA dioxygenase, peroxisomal-like n=1 Tax=Metopolophium dirhodum TaxID=44670 RepID=UPI00298F5C46|nr:phytanoyl-CoA dioxygenase, peroxisomal-like [Metopolophium dirhodum]